MTDPTARAQSGRVYDGLTVDAMLDIQLRINRLCAKQQAALGFAWGRVDELHQAVTAAEAQRDRYREHADRINAERASLGEELAAAQADARGVEARLRQQIARDLREPVLISLFAALIVSTSQAGVSAYDLAARILGDLADLMNLPERPVGLPAGDLQHQLDALHGQMPAAPPPAAEPDLPRPAQIVPRPPWWRRPFTATHH